MARLRQIEWDGAATTEANTATHLPVLIAAYYSEGRALVEEAADPEKLHRLRLISKRLRYTLELFLPCYGPELAKGLEWLKRLQDVLGELNDAVATWRLLEPMRGATRMKPILEAQAVAKFEEFRKEWREGFDVPGKEQWWVEFLAHPSRAGLQARPPLRKPARNQRRQA